MIYHDNQRRRDAGLSKVAAENQLPGSPPSRWDISGAGDPSIQGFATDISVNQGQPVSFKINDASGAPYHIEIYRMGYYQGNGARLVASIPSSQTLHQAQDDASADPTTGLLDDGQWAVSASWSVPADATSGIYFAKVIRDDTGGASHIFFVVRDDTDQSEILFKTSDATWQAYNDYGGKSLYDGQSSNGQRAYKVSYNRPFNTRADSPQDFVFNSEYPMVRWLEANGYDVSYFTDVDSDRNGALIKNHQVFLSVGHDEYWSGPQRANVEAARDNVGNPVNLAFFSANEVFWKTRWESSIHGSGADGSGTPYRTLVCYKETHANAVIDPMDPPTWTGTWRDLRFSPPADGGRPENALTGTIFMVNGIRNDAITVPAADGKMRFWRNTRIATLAPGATATLSTGTLGYEWDSDLDNGFRPAGLMDLSSTTLDVSPNYLLLDYGTEFGPGTATHHLTLYRASSGALVFGAGTTQWSWGLDGNHDRGSDAPDVDMQQATVNLLADMGVQPTTLQAGLTAATASTDVTAPTSTIISPAAGASIQNGSAVTITGTATDAGGGMIGGVEVSGDGGMTWHPATGRENWNYTWTPNSLGSVTIKSRAVDDSGNLETPSAGVSVSLAGPISIWSNSTAPVLAANPDTSATEVGVKFRSDVAGYITGIRYYKGSTNTGTHVGSLWTSTGTLLAQVTFTDETASGWQQATFDGPVPIAADTTYVASYHTNTGYYAEDDDYFASRGVDNGPLHALADGVDGPNGVYTYSDSSAFPTNTYRAANYWVDVVFSQNVWLHTTASDFGAGTHHGTVVTTSDFGAGTHDRTVVTNISRGEVQLAPGFSDDFNITPLSSAWTNTPWPGATPSVTVSGGILSVAGAQVRSVQAVPSGTPVEGRITIGSATNQQFGLGTDLSATTGNSWAVFSTKGTTGTLYAEVNSAGVVTTQKIGSRPTGYHVYRVQPFSSGFQFYIDGVLKTTISPCEAISKAIPRGTALKIGLASSNGTALIADWVRLASYASSGTFTSSASDAGRTATWGNATWTADLPAETTLIIETSSSTDGGTWSDWSSVGSGGAITSPSGRYLRYRVRITTTNPSQTATLYDISFTWN